jgi:hypothetical protein
LAPPKCWNRVEDGHQSEQPPTMMRQEPTPDRIRIAAPIRQARAEVSPMLPGSRPRNMDFRVKPA